MRLVFYFSVSKAYSDYNYYIKTFWPGRLSQKELYETWTSERAMTGEKKIQQHQNRQPWQRALVEALTFSLAT